MTDRSNGCDFLATIAVSPRRAVTWLEQAMGRRGAAVRGRRTGLERQRQRGSRDGTKGHFTPESGELDPLH